MKVSLDASAIMNVRVIHSCHPSPVSLMSTSSLLMHTALPQTLGWARQGFHPYLPTHSASSVSYLCANSLAFLTIKGRKHTAAHMSFAQPSCYLACRYAHSFLVRNTAGTTRWWTTRRTRRYSWCSTPARPTQRTWSHSTERFVPRPTATRLPDLCFE